MTLQDKIESAYNRKELFFKPWVGKQYEEGLLLKGDEKRRKVLIIGASRYCKIALGKENDLCSQASNCIGMVDHDKLSGLMSSCAFVQSLNKNGKLFDINQESILNHIGAGSEKTYKRFEKKLQEYLDGKDKEELWNHVSFINYLQCIIDTIDTPPRASSDIITSQFDESKVVVEKTISLLNPDIIILWGSATIKRNMRITSKKEHGCSRLFSNCTRIKNSIYDIIIENKTYPLMLTNYHPFYYKFRIEDRVFSDFVEHVKSNERSKAKDDRSKQRRKG